MTFDSENRGLERRRERAEHIKGSLERREMPHSEFELRERAGGRPQLKGYGSVCEVGYEVNDFVETMARGCFKRCLNEAPDVVLLTGHSGLPLARTKSRRGGPGTLRLWEDDHGLGFEADLDPGDQDAALVIRKLQRGDLDGQMSVAFRVTDQKWSSDYSERRITAASVDQGDVSIVVMAANPYAGAALREHVDPHRAARVAIPDYTTRAVEQLALRGVRLPQRPSPPPADVDPSDFYRRRMAEIRSRSR